MKTSFLSLPLALLSFGASATINAHDVDPYYDGWVAHVDDHRLEICYRSAPPPAVGQTLQILRTSFITPNKGPVREQYAPGGSARVTTAASDGCVTAELLSGTARRADHARSVVD
jgi:hypothetical protein